MTLASNIRATDDMREISHSGQHNEIASLLSSAGFSIGVSEGNTAAQNEAAFAAAIAALPDEGGTILIPPGTYHGQIPPITGLGHVRISGYGAILMPGAGEAGVTINQGVSSFVEGVTIEGLKIDGSAGGVTGVQLEDTNNACLRDMYIRDCATAVDFHSNDTNAFVEGTYIDNLLLRQNTVGLNFRITSGTGSFAQTTIMGLKCVVGDSGTGIVVADDCVLQRSFVHGLFFVGDGETALNIDGSMEDADWIISIEGAGGSTTNTALVVGANISNADSWRLKLNLTGTINTQISGSAAFHYEPAAQLVVQTAGTVLQQYRRHGDTTARLGIELLTAGPRFTFGTGGIARDTNLYRSAADTLKTDDSFHIGANLAHLGSNVGFYNTTPIAKQTGVAVTAAGIHAALVNLGLISA